MVLIRYRGRRRRKERTLLIPISCGATREKRLVLEAAMPVGKGMVTRRRPARPAAGGRSVSLSDRHSRRGEEVSGRDGRRPRKGAALHRED